MALAQRMPIEIVSVDSALVYRGMDIGTAKPSAAERAARAAPPDRHPRPGDAVFGGALFAADAQRLIGEIRARGATPLLVGGTMLYFKALIDGLDAMPAADAAVRAQVAGRRGRARLACAARRAGARRCGHRGAAGARRFAAHRPRARSLARQRARRCRASTRGRGRHAPTALISLEPDSRAWLHERIAQRFDAMLDAGFIDEVRRLRARPRPARRAAFDARVGYRQAWEALDAGLDGEALRAAVRERGIAATRQLAKRQLTWLRSMAQRRASWPCDAHGCARTLRGACVEASGT